MRGGKVRTENKILDRPFLLNINILITFSSPYCNIHTVLGLYTIALCDRLIKTNYTITLIHCGIICYKKVCRYSIRKRDE